MPVYVRRMPSKGNPIFQNRTVSVSSVDRPSGTMITAGSDVPDQVVLCNGCNKNQYPEPVYAIYLGKRELKASQIYDCYCLECIKKYFPKAVMVEGQVP